MALRYYSLLFGAGLLVGLSVAKRLWERKGFSEKAFDKLTLHVFLAIIFGSRIGHCLFYEPDYYLSHPLEMILPIHFERGGIVFSGFKGLASHGGILAVFLTTLFFCRKNKLSFLAIADIVCIGGTVTGAFIRLGNFMNSEIIGNPTNGDFGVIFKRIDEFVRHPSQLYESFAYLLIFMTLLIIFYRFKNRKDGFILGLYLIFLFTARFTIEFTKINQVGFEEGMSLNMGQLLSIPFFILGIILTLNRSNVLAFDK